MPRWRTALWRIRCVRAEPHNRVVCSPGDRRDIRDLIVMPAEGGHTSAPGPAEGAR
jgi:hypothetical protein